MKKFLLVGMCGAMLAACDSANVEMEKYCLQSAENSGMEITEETRAHCKCVNEQLIESFGAEKQRHLQSLCMHMKPRAKLPQKKLQQNMIFHYRRYMIRSWKYPLCVRWNLV